MYKNHTFPMEDGPIEDISIDMVDHCSFELNFSMYNFPNNASLTEPLTWSEYVKIALYVVVLVVALVGNISVILTVALNRSMRTTINLYLVNLAVADLFICLFCMWVPMVNSLTQPIYSLGEVFCKLNPFAQMTCLTSSVLTLCAISCDRFIAILFPLHVRITKQRTSGVLSAIWTVSGTVALPFLLVRKYNTYQWRDLSEPVCDDDWPLEERWDSDLGVCIRTYPMKQLYYTFVTVTLFFLPVAIMAVAYALIICRLWRTRAPGESNVANLNVQHRAKKKVIKMVCVVLVGFVACWSPLQVTVLYSEFVHSASQFGELPFWFGGFQYFSMFLAYFNSALNPVLYGGFNNNFRQGLCNVLQCAYAKQLRRPQFSQKSRTTHLSGSSTRVNGVGPVTRAIELHSIRETSHETNA
ncbi:hypothetical protein JTE90_013782 [Oedothorax gibbosus]|uniref:G-protein coupled receptors family 1 profile domain-containing protein n=1 Tax=Oedothorax gibbosus TaxID=931172 RepID=A0AAV6UYK4_9ARAC|nr:hypothetical protein JTE90_013782 [Oedothorax gibbosus]